jgi:hypothetical protein
MGHLLVLSSPARGGGRPLQLLAPPTLVPTLVLVVRTSPPRASRTALRTQRVDVRTGWVKKRKHTRQRKHTTKNTNNAKKKKQNMSQQQLGSKIQKHTTHSHFFTFRKNSPN